jgi:hypothetical protein
MERSPSQADGDAGLGFGQCDVRKLRVWFRFSLNYNVTRRRDWVSLSAYGKQQRQRQRQKTRKTTKED